MELDRAENLCVSVVYETEGGREREQARERQQARKKEKRERPRHIIPMLRFPPTINPMTETVKIKVKQKIGKEKHTKAHHPYTASPSTH